MKTILDQFIQKPAVLEKLIKPVPKPFKSIIEEQDEQALPESRSSTRNQGPEAKPRIRNCSYQTEVKPVLPADLKVEKTESSEYKPKRSHSKRAPSKKQVRLRR